MRLLGLLTALLITTTTTVCYSAAPVASPKYDEAADTDISDKPIVIDGVISGQSMSAINTYLANLLTTGDVPDQHQLDIIISSPGGSVTAGFIFIDRLKALQSRGTNVRCFVADVAASMAFQIYLQCNERYALNTSFLLWHRARIMGSDGPMTGPMMYALGVQLKQMDEHIWADVRSNMSSAPEQYLRFHFEHETLHTGMALSRAVPGFLTTSDSIPGLYEALLNDRVGVRTAQSLGLFGFLRGELIYIWSRALPILNQ